MKLNKLTKGALLLVFAVAFTSCRTTTTVTTSTKSTSVSSKKKTLPPGQAKKLNGDKSAKMYTPSRN
ncbi:hypothetical protein [Flavobacterium sp. C4GT6]|uniref:hypothetical protein n=1 Tax=Flavobacterium sp. C4GT6 TaxID=3103818 RepID=UPI002ED40EFE